MENSCAPSLVDLFLSFEKTKFFDRPKTKGKRKLTKKFDFSTNRINDLIVFKNNISNEFIFDIFPK